MPKKPVLEQTVAEIRDEPSTIREIAKLTGLDNNRVRERLDTTHGKSLVWTAFAPELMAPEDLAEQSVAYARTYELAKRLSEIANLTPQTIRNKLNHSHGKTLLRNLFDFGLTTETGSDTQSNADSLLDQTVTYIRENDLAETLARLTGLSTREVNSRIDEAHGKTLIRNLFDDVLAQATSTEETEEGSGEGKNQLVTGMGGPQHRQLQNHLAKIGRLRNLHVRTDWPIGAGFKPDVLWFTLDPDKETRAGAWAVFEIEFGQGSSISKSLSSLKHAHDLWPNARLTMIIPEQNRAAVQKKLPGAFHEIAESLHLVDAERCRDASDLYDLAVLVKAVKDERE